ncbi:MAG: ABC transporter ATP-binding protein [Deltaproteobacteria bacterium]|nr:ABC transporter ATP-binding protein [Deltaproteobacteria bacterium]
MLRIEETTMKFGQLVALNGVGFEVNERQIKALIGPNGAGKTTLFNIISGFLRPTFGDIFFNNEKITNRKPHQICRLGLARTYQITRLFREMTVLENIKAGCQPWTKSEIFSCGFKTRFCRREAKEIEHRSWDIIHRLGLEASLDTLAENLPIGEQKLLEIGRALATSPSLLLLDEPAGGLNEQETEKLAKTIFALRDDLNMTILLVEHDMNRVMEVADEIVVLNYGRQIAEGPPEDIRKMEEVIVAYLGKGVSKTRMDTGTSPSR